MGVWVTEGGCRTLLVPNHRGNVFLLRESKSVVPLLTRVASAPWVPPMPAPAYFTQRSQDSEVGMVLNTGPWFGSQKGAAGRYWVVAPREQCRASSSFLQHGSPG